MIETPGAKIRENFGKSKRANWGGGCAEGGRGALLTPTPLLL